MNEVASTQQTSDSDARRFDGAENWALLTPQQQAEIGATALEYVVGFLAYDNTDSVRASENALARAAHAAWDQATENLIAVGTQALPETAWRAEGGQARIPACLGPVCRACGCSEHDACAGRCGWAEDDLCTACVAHSATAGRVR